MIEKPKESETVDVIMDDDIDIGVEIGYHCCIRNMNNWLKSVCENKLSADVMLDIIFNCKQEAFTNYSIAKAIAKHIKEGLKI